MKLLRTAVLAAGLTALGACGGTAENTAANNVAEEVYNVAPDDLGGDTLGNEADANASAGNEADANASAGNAQ